MILCVKSTLNISEGQNKARPQQKNLGEGLTTKFLVTEATGKYIGLLHSDDMYMPGALQHLYEAADADVVHTTNILRSGKDGVINADTKLTVHCWDKLQVDKPTLMPNDPMFRLQTWVNRGVSGDAPFNLFRREFLIENNLVEIFHSHEFVLLWLMKAKVFVKTPFPFYVYRDAPDSTSRNNHLHPLSRFLNYKMERLRVLEEELPTIDIFKDNEPLQTFVKILWLSRSHQIQIRDRGFYKDGIQTIYNIFKKYFGDNALYPTMLFHWIHIIPTPYNMEDVLFANIMPLINSPKK